MESKLNDKFNIRDNIIFGKPINWGISNIGKIIKFKNLSFNKLKTLKQQNFLDPNETQNDSPTIQEIMDFMEINPKFTAHGYAISPNRDDYRISIEGVYLQGGYTKKELKNFTKLFNDADDFQIKDTELYAWYD